MSVDSDRFIGDFIGHFIEHLVPFVSAMNRG